MFSFLSLVESIKILTELGGNANAQNNLTGASPLHMVAQSTKVKSFDDRLKVIQFLLKAGADINQTDNYGRTPGDSLMGVLNNITESEIDQLRDLLFDKSIHQTPPIYDAINERDIEKLHSAIADDALSVNLELDGKTPIIYSLSELDQIIETSYSGEEANVASSIEQIQKLGEIIEILISKGGNPNTVPKVNKRLNMAAGLMEETPLPLHQAVCALRILYEKESSDCIKILKNITVLLHEKGGAAVSAETTKLLYQAARHNEINFLEFLINDLKFDPNSVGPQSMTPLHFAARSGSKKVLVSNHRVMYYYMCFFGYLTLTNCSCLIAEFFIGATQY